MNMLAHSNRITLCVKTIFIVSLVSCILSGCKNNNNEPTPDIAVANSYLSAVVKDLCGNQQQVFDLVPPGMCPGHFDISPSQVNLLCNCKILFVFDFQKNIEKAIPRIKERGLKVSTVKSESGMCVPETYLSTARQVATALSEQKPLQKKHYESRLIEIEQRLNTLSENIVKRINKSELRGTKVITSGRQAEFAKWLGLDYVSTFAGRDTVTPAQIDQYLQAARESQIKIVIANKQEGTEMAETLADHLNVKCVVFSNFPGNDKQHTAVAGYDDLVTENINRLIEAMQ